MPAGLFLTCSRRVLLCLQHYYSLAALLNYCRGLRPAEGLRYTPRHRPALPAMNTHGCPCKAPMLTPACQSTLTEETVACLPPLTITAWPLAHVHPLPLTHHDRHLSRHSKAHPGATPFSQPGRSHRDPQTWMPIPSLRVLRVPHLPTPQQVLRTRSVTSN